MADIFQREYEAQVRRMVAETFRRQGVASALATLLNERDPLWPRQKNSRGLRARVARALAARARFEQVKPAWAPPLPLNAPACMALQGSEEPRLRLLGWWSGDLFLRCWWRLDRYPDFRAHACASMAAPWVDPMMRLDEDLRAEFPPQPLDPKKFAGTFATIAGRAITVGKEVGC